MNDLSRAAGVLAMAGLAVAFLLTGHVTTAIVMGVLAWLVLL